MLANLHRLSPSPKAEFTFEVESETLRCTAPSTVRESLCIHDVRRIRAGRLADFSAARATLGARAAWMFELLTADELWVLVAESEASFKAWLDAFGDAAPQHFPDASDESVAASLRPLEAERGAVVPPLPPSSVQPSRERRALIATHLPAAFDRVCRSLERCTAGLADPATSDDASTFRMRSSSGALRAQVRVRGAMIDRATIALNFSNSRHSTSAAVKLELRAGECWTLAQIVNSRNFGAAALSLAQRGRACLAQWGSEACGSDEATGALLEQLLECLDAVTVQVGRASNALALPPSDAFPFLARSASSWTPSIPSETALEFSIESSDLVARVLVLKP
jgi:hypothetical protein